MLSGIMRGYLLQVLISLRYNEYGLEGTPIPDSFQL